MNELQLKELYSYVKGHNLFKAGDNSNSLGKVAGYYMNGETATLVLDTELEVAVSKITQEKKYLLDVDISDGGLPQQQPVNVSEQKQKPHSNNPMIVSTNSDVEDINADGDAFSDTDPAKKIQLTKPDPLIEADENGVPRMQFEPLAENSGTQPSFRQQLHKPQPVVVVAPVSPIISLLEKAKTKPFTLKFELEVEGYDESLISVLSASFEDAPKDVIDYIISKIPNEKMKEKISEQLRALYKFS